MKLRFRNQHIDVEIEGDDREEIVREFRREYPTAAAETVVIEEVEG